MRAIPLLTLVLIAGTAGAQQSDRWVPVSITADGMVTEYDAKTISRTGDGVTVWVRYTYTRSPPVVYGKAVHHAMQRQYFNCSSLVSGVYSIITYTEDGNVVSSNTYERPSFESNVPGSVGEQTLDALCN
jgi:hypothetical protein